MLARRQEPAGCCARYVSPGGGCAMRDHPLHAVQQELHVHGYCTRTAVDIFDRGSRLRVSTRRFPGVPLPTNWRALSISVPRAIRSSWSTWWRLGRAGVAGGAWKGSWTLRVSLPKLQAGIPASLRQMIEQQLDRLRPEEQRVLEAGSVAGVEFSAAAVAAGVDQERRADRRAV